MTINTPNKSTAPETNQPQKSSSQSYHLLDDRNAIRHGRKQLDLDGIRELILEIRI